MTASEIRRIFGGNLRCEFRNAPRLSLVHSRGFVSHDANSPIVGIVNPYGEILSMTPVMTSLSVAVKAGLYLGAATPVLVRTLGLAATPSTKHLEMTCTLPEPDVMAQSLSAIARTHRFDAMVLMPNCGKIALGMLIAAAKINLPAIFHCEHLTSAGLNPEENCAPIDRRSLAERDDSGSRDGQPVARIGASFQPNCAGCWGMREAQSISLFIEALGMSLPEHPLPRVGLASRFRLAKKAGRAIVELWRQGIRTSHILTTDAFRNALTVGVALGCSPTTLQDLVSAANEAGVRLGPQVLNQLSMSILRSRSSSFGSPYQLDDMADGRGISAFMADLARSGLIELDCMSVSGRTLAQDLERSAAHAT